MRQPVPFGKYLLLDRISVGGMAEVFKAKSYGVEGFEKIIAIKRILPTMGEDRDFIKMFIDEAKIAGQLAHANICQIFELGRIDGSHFIAMEYIWGKDLLQIQNRLRKIKQPMPVAMACFSMAKVLEGLDYAHRKRDPLGRPLEIVHRDCSPQNVLVSYEGEVKVIDFGIAKATSRNSRTMAGVLKGKFGYMSPEQVRGLPLDRRSDIFALGTMLYECLTSERLFQGETDFSTLEKVRNVDIRPPREINPNIPEAVERVILKALAKDVEDRYQWCSEMLADLQQFLMAQDVVFTAKTLSGWLKEVFASEIERERQQLEEYKRVGRDGLIAGMPAAVAKLDVIKTLGEASPPEGDATQLGGPNFDDLEAAMASGLAALQASGAGPARGSPAATGNPRAAAPAVADDPNDADDDVDPEDFGEEAPTEIFGDHDAPPPAAVAAPRNPTSQGPASRPKPPGRPTPSAPQSSYGASSSMPTPALRMQSTPGLSGPTLGGGFAPSAPAGMNPYASAQSSPQQGFNAQGFGEQNADRNGPSSQKAAGQHGFGSQSPAAHGTPSHLVASPAGPTGQPLNAPAPAGQPQGKTLMGAAPPPGVPNYSQGYPNPQYPAGSQSAPYSQPYPSQGGVNYSQPYPSVGGASGQMGALGGAPGHGGMNPYGQPNQYGNGSMPPVEAVPVVPEGQRKSSIGRDVAIGVAIAAVVLGGFLAVKFLVLDKSSDSAETTSSSSIATLRLALPAGVSAELYVDDKKVATVGDKQEIPVNSGQRRVKLLGAGGARCEQELKLPAGKVTTVECIMYQGGATEGSADAGSNAGSAGSGSASAGSGATDKAAADKAAADKAAADKAAADKAAADKAAADKAAANKAVVDKAAAAAANKASADKTATDKAAADKAAADKAAKDKAAKLAADKAAADKVASADRLPKDRAPKDKPPRDKLSKDKLPVEENPIDRAAAMPSKGFLKVLAPAGATILIDGAPPTSSLSKLSLSPGKHKVTFLLGTDKHAFSVVVKAGETTVLDKKDLQ